MDIKITTANCEVITSGLVTSFNNEPICITIPTKSDPFKITFEFYIDKSIEGQEMSADASTESEVILKLTNFNSPLGTGTINPISFGTETTTGKKLYINFYVHVVGKSSPTLHYTIYKEM